MIDVNSFYIKFKSYAGTQWSGFLQPHKYDDVLNGASNALFERLCEEFKESQVGYDKLVPFIKSKNLMTTQPLGIPYALGTFPKDYRHYATMRAFFMGEKESCACPAVENVGDCSSVMPDEFIPIREVEVIKIDPNKWSSIINHKRLCPTLEKPACCQYDTGFRVAPRDLRVVTLDYFSQPAIAHWGYVDVNGFFVYNAATSVQIEWNENASEDLMEAMMPLYARATRDGELAQLNQISKTNP